MEPADSFEHAGLAVRILWEEYIDDNDDPRKQDGNIGVMFCDYQGYNLGDADADDPREQTITCPDCEGSGEGRLYEVTDVRAYGRERVSGPFPTLGSADMYIALNKPEDASWACEPTECERCEGNGNVELSIVEYLKREHNARVILPLFVYEHSGITISAGGRLDTGEDNLVSRNRFPFDGAGWDTSTVGVIFFSPELAERWGVPSDISDEEIEKQLNEEVELYAAYLEGSVFGYEIVEPELDGGGEFDPADCDGEVLDSCWGFLETNFWSDDCYVKIAAREAADSCREQLDAERVEAHRWACADVVTV